MKHLALTCCSLYCTRRASSFFLPCNLDARMKKRVLSTRATAETGLTKISVTAASAGGNDGNARKKIRQAVEESITDETIRDDIVSNPWYTFFTKGDAEYGEYMATEWGFERRGDVALFEKLSLEGAQSGLSWLTVLRKRPAYRKAFYNFDPAKVALMTENDVQKLIDFQSENPRDQLVRHRGKIESVINNAKCIVQLREELSTKETTFGVFDDLLWSFVDNRPILSRCSLSQLPSKSPESEAMSNALKKRGFKFVGPTTCYSMMQALGMVIDHPMDSPEWLAAYERLKQRPGGFQERSP
ncbi:DNA-3-methyladenine glycosylase I [Fistulifera solaris]|uniref:DNA-3-methyladenine glycosylase I n=1 Tax=Fistulifera solaris TaxID=1519565 RepID=A0A1Z5JKE1_FISSO|nr:DNA-3-methyladenine glycosylase I [Fistulifera solaris]|eukprot:GAX14459.1 DNA-3-methyladenine glycosylase I [Fistulifera solaris]